MNSIRGLKHIDVFNHLIREFQSCGEITLFYVPTRLQVIDIVTKTLIPNFFAELRDAPHKANRHKSNNFPTLTQNKPYTYLDIHLMSSLKWNLQKEIALQKTKLQCKLLTLSPASLKQKTKILNTIIKLHISYVYYAVPFSKLDI